MSNLCAPFYHVLSDMIIKALEGYSILYGQDALHFFFYIGQSSLSLGILSCQAQAFNLKTFVLPVVFPLFPRGALGWPFVIGDNPPRAYSTSNPFMSQNNFSDRLLP